MAELNIIELSEMQEGLTEQQKMVFLTQYNSEKKDRNIALIISLILGSLGIDRFYLGDTTSGIIKLLTAGLCGVWYVIDWFLIMNQTDTRNRTKAKEILYVIKHK
ncbi:MAG: TM2 domain-containing protein [Elusimicrobiaceae bacterium]